MIKLILIICGICSSVLSFAQVGFKYPGNYPFKVFMDGEHVYNYSGNDFILGRNISPKTDLNFTLLKNSISNWSLIRTSKKTKLFTQIQRSDEFYFKDNGLTNKLIRSFGDGFNWNPDTILNLSESRLGIIGYQDWGSWFEWEGETKSRLAGIRIRNYSNIYAFALDSGQIANRYTSSLSTGTEYTAYAEGTQIYLAGNSNNLNLLLNDPLNLLTLYNVPRNFLVLIDFTERTKIHKHHEVEVSLIGIPIFNHLSELISQKIKLSWEYSGVNIQNLDSILPGINFNRDTNLVALRPNLYSKSNIFQPSQELHLLWTFKPKDAFRFTAKYSYFSDHFFNNTNLAFGIFQNHGKNLQIMTRLNFSNQFGNWNEIGFLFRPTPFVTVNMNLSGTDFIRLRETLQIKRDFNILRINLGLFANL